MFFFFKQKTAYEMRISDWSSDVCSSDLGRATSLALAARGAFVWVTDFDLAGADRTVQLIEETGGRARSFRLDVRLEEDWQEGLALTDSHEDALTGLVKCGGQSMRSEERSVGKECVSQGGSGWSPTHYKKD